MVKPLLEENEPHVNHAMSTYDYLDSPLEKRSKVNFNCEQIQVYCISIACLVVSIFFQASHFKLMFCVFCRDTQPFPSPFVPFYAHSDFFPNPLSYISLPEYAKGITQQMVAYSTPPSSSNKREYDNLVLRFINDEAIENLD